MTTAPMPDPTVVTRRRCFLTDAEQLGYSRARRVLDVDRGGDPIALAAIAAAALDELAILREQLDTQADGSRQADQPGDFPSAVFARYAIPAVTIDGPTADPGLHVIRMWVDILPAPTGQPHPCRVVDFAGPAVVSP